MNNLASYTKIYCQNHSSKIMVCMQIDNSNYKDFVKEQLFAEQGDQLIAVIHYFCVEQWNLSEGTREDSFDKETTIYY